MAAPQKEKTMSSRLLTMKFMQRAAASTSGPSSPDSPGGRAAKRQRISDPASNDSPRSDLEAVQAALAAEDLKRNQALERQAVDAGDTKWTLNFKNKNDNPDAGPRWNVVSAGFSAIDTFKSAGRVAQTDSEDNDSFEKPTGIGGRKSFGNFKPANETSEKSRQTRDSVSDASSDESEEETPESQNESGDGERKHKSPESESQRRRKRKGQDSPHSGPKAKERRKYEEVRLDKLSSISGGGASSGLSKSSDSQKCFKCGSSKHKKKDCPALASKR